MIGLPYRWLRRYVAELLFDRRYGVRTSGRVDLGELGLAHEERVYYIASNWRTLRRALDRYEITTDDVFIDIGSGMGRMVLEASRYPFKRVIGVELASQLHAIAEQNVRRMRGRARCGEIELVNTDILDYEFPDDVTFVYMFNPFRGAIFRRAIDALIRSLDRNPRSVHLIYLNPFEEPYLLRTRRFQVDGADKGARLYRSVERPATGETSAERPAAKRPRQPARRRRLVTRSGMVAVAFALLGLMMVLVDLGLD